MRARPGSAPSWTSRRRSRHVGIWLVALGLVSVQCKKTSAPPAAAKLEAPFLGPVLAQDLTAGTRRAIDVAVDPASLAAAVRGQLQAAGIFRSGPADAGVQTQPIARVRVDFVIEDVVADKKAAARAGIRLRIDIRPSDHAPAWFAEDAEAGGELMYSVDSKLDRQELFAKLVARTVYDLLSAYIARQKLWSGGPDLLRSALLPEAGDLRIHAIHAIGERHLTGLSDHLLSLLSDEDEIVRDAALGALLELRERRAVAELARLRSMRDRREMRKILDAVAVLGGQEAGEYLAFVAAGHEDEEIRSIATAALRRLGRRSDGAIRP